MFVRRHRFVLAFVLSVLGALGCGLFQLSELAEPTRQGSPAALVTPTPDPLAQAYARLEAASTEPLHLTLEGEFPRGVLGEIPVEGRTPHERARSYLDSYAEFYRQSDPNLELHLRRTTAETATFYQTYKGLRVYGAQLVVMSTDEAVTATVGMLLEAGAEIDTTPGLTPELALQAAKDELRLQEFQVVGKPRLVIFDPTIAGSSGSETRLAWQINVEGSRSLEALVDASDGAVLLAYSRRADHSVPYQIIVRDASYTNSSETLCYYFTPGELLGLKYGLIGDGQTDPEAQAALQVGEDTWQYFHNSYGLHSYDNDGEPILVYVHSSTSGTASFSCGGLFQFTDGSIVPDIFAHEFSHGIDSTHGGLKYVNQSGALDESFADVMGAMFDGNWTVAEGISGNPFRDMSNPGPYGDPDHMSEFLSPSDCADPEDASKNDNGCVHSNSGIPNYVAFMLSDGGYQSDTQEFVPPIGKAKTAALHFDVLTLFMTTNSQFIDARNAAVAVAQAKWGNEDACKVRNAWFAVGIGNPDKDCDGQEESAIDSDGDLIPDGDDNCTYMYNPSQTDKDFDGIGDACDPDRDGNGIPDAEEDLLDDPYLLCPTPGVYCDDDDWDEDGIDNEEDNCVFTKNEDQADTDNDGEGDACDPDSDGDGISDNDDNCINTANADQANADGDLAGDLCDPTPTCSDVYAWSAGNSIVTEDGPIQTEPQPIADPLACPPVFVNEVEWTDDKPEIDPDGEGRRIRVPPDNDPLAIIPIPICPPESPAGSPSDVRQILRLQVGEPGLHAWMSNDLGEIVARDRDEGPAALLPFVPMGGDLYYLVVNRADWPQGEAAEFDLSIDCEPRPSAQATPDPDGTEAAPTATPTPRYTNTPDGPATSTPRPSPTPPPTDTPRVTPTDTPQSRLPTDTPTSRGG